METDPLLACSCTMVPRRRSATCPDHGIKGWFIGYITNRAGEQQPLTQCVPGLGILMPSQRTRGARDAAVAIYPSVAEMATAMQRLGVAAETIRVIEDPLRFMEGFVEWVPVLANLRIEGERLRYEVVIP